MYILLLIALVVQVYSESLEIGLWSYTRESCQQNCVALNRGNCDQQQILAANTPEKVNQILKARIHPVYNCEEYEMGDKVGYSRIDRHKYKCYYMDPELSIEDTANACNIFQPTNNLCPCSNNVNVFISTEPTNQPTGQPTITFPPTTSPTLETNSMTHKKQSIHINNTIILLVVSGLVLIIVLRLLILLYSKYCRGDFNRKSATNREKIIPVTISDVIPIVEAYVVEYPQPSAPPMSSQSRNISEKTDIEMGVIKK